MVAECLAIRKVHMMTIKKTFSRIIIDSDSKLVVNAIHGKILVLHDIINLVEDIRNICHNFKEVTITYCATVCNSEADGVAKMSHNI